MDAIYTEIGLEPFSATQIKILNAAKRCLLKWGIEKTNINDIAKMAGVTRPTVYSNFETKENVIGQTLLFSGYEFATKIVEHVARFNSDKERYIEAVAFAIEELPKEPFLSVITDMEFSDLVRQDALQNPKGVILCLAIFNEIFKDSQHNSTDLVEIIEITVRVALSFIMIESPIHRTREELKAFLSRRMLIPGGA